MKTSCTNYIEDPCVCDSQGDPKGQCANCGWKWYEHAPSALPDEPAEPKYVLAVAVEYLARSKRPKENWPQFLSLVKSTGCFDDSQIDRWNKEYNAQPIRKYESRITTVNHSTKIPQNAGR